MENKIKKSIVQLPTEIDIYSGEENIQFNNRHPIFKTLMKLEFEEILRNFSNKPFRD